MFVKCSNLKLLTHSLSVHPHWVLGCSRSQHFFFLFSLVLGLNTLPGVLAFCMAYAWLGELTRHTFLSHSLGLMSFFFSVITAFCLIHAEHPLFVHVCALCVFVLCVCGFVVLCICCILCLHLFWDPQTSHPPLPSLPFLSLCPAPFD